MHLCSLHGPFVYIFYFNRYNLQIQRKGILNVSKHICLPFQTLPVYQKFVNSIWHNDLSFKAIIIHNGQIATLNELRFHQVSEKKQNSN